MAYKKKIKKNKLKVDTAIAHISSTFNNTMVSITTLTGDVLLQASSGRLGFKGSRKGTPYAGAQIGAAAAKGMKDFGIRTVEVNAKGPGVGRESLIRAISSAGFRVSVVRDVTPLPHNGGRAPKKRRV